MEQLRSLHGGHIGGADLRYAGFAVFSMLNPLAAIAIALLGFRMRRPETAEPVAKPDRGLAEADEVVLLDDSATTIESAQPPGCFDRPFVLVQTFLKGFAEPLRSGQRTADHEFIGRSEIIAERRERLGQLTDDCRRRSYLACEGGALRADVSVCHNSKTSPCCAVASPLSSPLVQALPDNTQLI